MRKYLSNTKGLTLMELIVTLAIFGMVSLLLYSMLTFTYKTSNTQLKESNQRNEVRVVSTFLKNDIEYSKDLTVVDPSTLRLVNSANETITYSVQRDAEGNSYLTRQSSSSHEFRDIADADFRVLNDHLVQAKLITDISANKFTEFKIFRWDMTVQRPIPEEDIRQILIRDKVFVLGNRVSISGGAIVTGDDATVIIKNDLSLSGGNEQHIVTKNIYIDGGLSLSGSAGIGSEASSIFIAGDCSIESNGKLYGNTTIEGNFSFSGNADLKGSIYVDGDVTVTGGNYSDLLNAPIEIFYTGKLSPSSLKGVLASKVPNLEAIKFPNISIPALQRSSWYAERGYTSIPTSQSGMKYFGDSYTFGNIDGKTYDDVIIVSTGDIHISGKKQVTGILFAPKGDVTISGGAVFRGLIIADNTIVSGNSSVTFEAVQIDDLPF